MSHEKYAACIDACYACAAACDHCSTACLTEANVSAMADCIRTDIDCADICRFAAAAMARNSEFVKDILKLCTQICTRCGDICNKHEHDHCQQCAQACKACVEECWKLTDQA